MDRRTFVLTPIAFASLYGAVPAFTHAASTGAPNSVRVPISFSKISAGRRPLWRDVDRMEPGDVSIQLDLWLRVDVDPAPPGGVLVRPSVRIIEDSLSGRRPILNSFKIEGKSAPKSNVVHVVGKTDGLAHVDVFRPLGLEIGIHQVYLYNPAEQSGATVSTVPDKDSFIIVTTT